MADYTILAMTGEDEWFDRLRSDLHDLGGTRIILTESMEETTELLDSAGARLIVLNWGSQSVSYEQMSELLWANTTLSRPAAVLVITDTYHAEQAATLFQMGVDEYVCISSHGHKMRAILGQLLPGKAARTFGIDETPSVTRKLPEPQPISANWVTAAAAIA
jgi:DNA-binding NarL/FixJ family response regulator